MVLIVGVMPLVAVHTCVCTTDIVRANLFLYICASVCVLACSCPISLGQVPARCVKVCHPVLLQPV